MHVCVCVCVCVRARTHTYIVKGWTTQAQLPSFTFMDLNSRRLWASSSNSRRLALTTSLVHLINLKFWI